MRYTFNMNRTFLLSLIALPIMLVLDLFWIGVVANGFYRTELGALYAPTVVWQAAMLFYLIYAAGLTYFVIAPAVRAHSFVRAIFGAAFFALVAYGTYDLTSLAITTNWPFILTIVDMSWGIAAGMIVSGSTYLIATKVFKM